MGYRAFSGGLNASVRPWSKARTYRYCSAACFSADEWPGISMGHIRGGGNQGHRGEGNWQPSIDHWPANKPPRCDPFAWLSPNCSLHRPTPRKPTLVESTPFPSCSAVANEERDTMSYYFAIVGAQDNPLFEYEFGTSKQGGDGQSRFDEQLRHLNQIILHSSLDIAEEVQWAHGQM